MILGLPAISFLFVIVSCALGLSVVIPFFCAHRPRRGSRTRYDAEGA